MDEEKESGEVRCGTCVTCQRCFEAQTGSCPQCYECQSCIVAQGGQPQQRPGWPQQRRPDGRMQGCPPMMGRPQQGGQQRCPPMMGGPQQGGGCPQGMQRGQQMLTEVRVKEIILEVLIAAGVIEDKQRKGIELK